jgi:transposase
VDKAQPFPRLASIDRSQLILHSVDVENLIEQDHSARAIWELIGRLDLSLYYAEIAAVEGEPGRDHTAPQLLISLWLSAYSRGISSARELSRQCGFEPGFAWLCGLRPISHRTLAGFRSAHREAVDDLFVQVVGMLSAEGLITMERFTLDGTKIKANASGNTFHRKEKIEAPSGLVSATTLPAGSAYVAGSRLRLPLGRKTDHLASKSNSLNTPITAYTMLRHQVPSGAHSRISRRWPPPTRPNVYFFTASRRTNPRSQRKATCQKADSSKRITHRFI